MSSPSPRWFKVRRYLHFDPGVTRAEATALVTAPERVARHSFYPFIRYSLSALRVRREGERLVPIRKERPITYAAHLDSHLYSYYAEQLGERYEAELQRRGLSGSVRAFRRLGQTPVDTVAQIFNQIRQRSECIVLVSDIRQFFDRIDHLRLKQAWAALLGVAQLPPDHYAIYRSITRYSWVDREALHAVLPPVAGDHRRLCDAATFRQVVRKGGLIQRQSETYGIPQGMALGNLLSNLYLLAFDTVMQQWVAAQGGEYYRYCDDLLLILPPEAGAAGVEQIREALTAEQLAIHEDKTQQAIFYMRQGVLTSDRPLDYLGLSWNGQGFLIRSSTFHRAQVRMRRGVAQAKRSWQRHRRQAQQHDRPAPPLYRQSLYRRYSHLGRRSFVRYALNAAQKLDSASIRRQIRPLWRQLQAAMESDGHGGR